MSPRRDASKWFAAGGITRNNACTVGTRTIVLLGALLCACSEAPQPKLPPPPAGLGVTFAWPRDGQRDVPVRAPVVLRFSDQLNTPTLDCGSFCVEGPSGPVAGKLTVSAGNTIVFTPTGAFDEGTTYRVRASVGLLTGGTNLERDPLITFTTRQTRPIRGTPAAALTLNDGPLDGGALPFLDVSPLRLLFSEPVDPSSVSSATVTLANGDGGVVPASLAAGGAHVVIDPLSDLTAGTPYTLTLSGVRDLGGEPLAPLTVKVVPQRTALPEGLIRQTLAITPAWSATGPLSPLSGAPVNASQAASPLIGSATLGLLGGGLEAQLGDPSAFGGPIPMVIRRGQQLDLSPLAIRFGGALESGYETRTLHFTVLNDAVGFLTRNPFRPAEQLPDERAPVFVDLTMDTVVTAEDAQGNALATQTVMGLRLLGLSSVDDDQLVVDQIGALDFGTLGINVAPTTLALRLRTGATVAPPAIPTPALTATFPTAGDTEAAPDTAMHLVFSGPVVLDAATFALTENNAPVATSARVDGSTVIVTAARRFADGATIKLTHSGLASPSGQSVAAGSLSFATMRIASTTTPPKLASVTIGAPCALTRTSATSAGACAGGETSDGAYAAFALPANRDVRVGFTQAMKVSAFVQGSACGTGAIRVERLTSAGTCEGVVSGTLFTHDRGFRFVPSAPWTPGTQYRLVLVAGSNGTCDGGELCSRANVPLNTDPLAGLESAGGPDVVIRFTATAPTPDSLQPLSSEPYADLNSNGDVDGAEVMHDENRVAMEVAGTSGIVTDASLNGADCVPGRMGKQVCVGLRTELPVSVGALQERCPLDGNGAPTTSGGPCLEVRVLPNVIFNTSMSMNTTAIGFLPINDLPTHEMIMRIREPSGPALGYILRDPGDAFPQFVIRQSVYLDAPDLRILGGVVSHDVKSKPLDVVLKGPVTFLPDGRMRVALQNLADVPLRVSISALATGAIDLRIPKGEMHLTLVGGPLR